MAGRKKSISPQKGNKNDPIVISDSSTRVTRSASQNDVTMGRRDVTTPLRDVTPREESGAGFSARKMFRKSRPPGCEKVTSSGGSVTSPRTEITAEQTKWSWGPDRVKARNIALNTAANKTPPSASSVKRLNTTASAATGFSARSLKPGPSRSGPSASQKGSVKQPNVRPPCMTSVTSNRNGPDNVVNTSIVNRNVNTRGDKKTPEQTNWSWGPQRVQQKQSGKDHTSTIPSTYTSRTDTDTKPGCSGLSAIKNAYSRPTPRNSANSSTSQEAVKRKSNVVPKSTVEFTPSPVEGRVFAVAKRRSGGVIENSRNSRFCGMVQSPISTDKSVANLTEGREDCESPCKIAKISSTESKTSSTMSSCGSKTSNISGSKSNSGIGGHKRNSVLNKPSLLGSKPSLLGAAPGTSTGRVPTVTTMSRIPLKTAGAKLSTCSTDRSVPRPKSNFQNQNFRRSANSANEEKQTIKSSRLMPSNSKTVRTDPTTPPKSRVQKLSYSSDTGIDQKFGKTKSEEPKPDRTDSSAASSPRTESKTATSSSSKTDKEQGLFRYAGRVPCKRTNAAKEAGSMPDETSEEASSSGWGSEKSSLQGLFRYASKVPCKQDDTYTKTSSWDHSSKPEKSSEGWSSGGWGAEKWRDEADSSGVTESMSVSALTDRGEVVTVRQSCSQEVMEWADEEETRWISQNQQITSPMVSKVRRDDDVCGMDLDSDDDSPAAGEDSSRDTSRDTSRDAREPRVVYVVCDTCIMSPRVIEHIRDLKLNNGATVCIVIPWVVMQELDVMKDNKRSQFSSNRQTKAQRGVKAIHSWLTDQHPRVQAQTAVRDSEPLPGLTEEVNDDRILKCCLQYAREVGPVVLYTEDINLSNKAMISGITPHNSQHIVKELLKIQIGSPGRPTKGPNKGTSRAQNSQWSTKQAVRENVPNSQWSAKEAVVREEEAKSVEPPVDVPAGPVIHPDPERKALVDSILVDLKQIMYTVLAPYLEQEMKKEYREMYLDVIKIKPPWTTVDVLDNLDKHWIAVFGDLIGRQHQSDVKTLLEALKPGSDVTSGRDDVTDVVKSAAALVEALVGKASAAVTNLPAVLKLKERWKRAQHFLNQSQPSSAHRVTKPTQSPANQRPSQTTPTRSSANQRPSRTTPTVSPANQRNDQSSNQNYQNCDNRNFSSQTMTDMNNQHRLIQSLNPNNNQADNRLIVDAENAVMTKFQYLWNSMNNMIQEIISALEFGSSVPRQTVLSRVRSLSPVLALLRDIYRSALTRAHSQDVSLLAQALNELSASLQLPQNQPEDVPISADQLSLVCASREKRPLLENGLVQLEGFIKDLQTAQLISISPRTFS